MLVIFNLITTWWIWNALPEGMVMAVLVNAFLLTCFMALFHGVHRKYGHFFGYSSFIFLWMAYEYFHYHWELSWPWLNLGNSFATSTTWVQWYEYTGIGGGTLWILLLNLIAFFIVKNIYLQNQKLKSQIAPLTLWLTVFALPLFVSFSMYNGYKEKINPINIVVVQPNINPYGDKFNYLTAQDQMMIFLQNAFVLMDSTVDFVIGPETALPYSIEEKTITRNEEVNLLHRKFSSFNKTCVLIGMSSHHFFNEGEKIPENLPQQDDGSYVEKYNSALFMDGDKMPKIYHKMQLVLGVEKVPFAKYFRFMENWAADLGGTKGSLGIEKGPKIFSTEKNKAIIAPSICYESIFGEHMAAFVNNGANVIFVITNDGWWGDTPGYKQHFDYARLTCISLRRSIAQSANTGYSGFINQRGDIVEKTKWWVPTALKHKINLNNNKTFYAINGDYLYRVAAFFSLLFALLYIYAWVTGKNYSENRSV